MTQIAQVRYLLTLLLGTLGLTCLALSAQPASASATTPTTSDIRAANGWVAASLRSANGNAMWRIGVREDLTARRLVITAPPESARTASQRKLVADISSRFGQFATVEVKEVRFTRLGCTYPFCNPPLRAGIEIDSSGVSCTGSFLARSRTDNKLYQMTAGHCNVNPGATWSTRFANREPHNIGPFHRSAYGPTGDGGIIRVSNPSGWRSRAWVLVTSGPDTTANANYPIRADGNSSVGQRVCVTGAQFGRTDCGTVTAVNVTADFGDAVISGLVEASICAIPGDSGGPVFAHNTAYGLLIGTASLCDAVFEPARTEEDLLNVSISHDAG